MSAASPSQEYLTSELDIAGKKAGVNTSFLPTVNLPTREYFPRLTRISAIIFYPPMVCSPRQWDVAPSSFPQSRYDCVYASSVVYHYLNLRPQWMNSINKVL